MILTPQQLWKDYNRFKEPFNISQLSQTTSDFCVETYYYFYGEKFKNASSRIFARLVDPIAGRGENVIIVFDDINNSIDKFDCTSYIENGYSVLVVDYSGEIGNKTRYTMYPKDLDFANAGSDKNNLNDIKINAHDSCWYIWGITAIRSVAFAESLNFTRRFAIGIGHGGENVWKICYDQSLLVAGSVVFSGGADIYSLSDKEWSNQDSLAYFAGINSASYAPLIKTPMFMQVTSNEQNGSLDFLNELYSACTNNSSYMSIISRSNRNIPLANKNDILMFFNSARDNAIMMSAPKITFKGDDNNLYLSSTVEDNELIKDIVLYVAYSQDNCAYRNWRTLPLDHVGNDYFAKVPLISTTEPIYTFINITLTNGFSISSQVHKVKPMAYSVKKATLNHKRLVYDTDMGVDDWIILNEVEADYQSNKPLLNKGIHDIEGVCSLTNELSTFKLADFQFAGKDNYILQLLVFSDKEQDITFTITCGDSFKKYTCIKKISDFKNWNKLSFELNEFKCNNIGLDSWENILTFEIKSQSLLLVNSVLWV